MNSIMILAEKINRVIIGVAIWDATRLKNRREGN